MALNKKYQISHYVNVCMHSLRSEEKSTWQHEKLMKISDEQCEVIPYNCGFKKRKLRIIGETMIIQSPLSITIFKRILSEAA